MHEVEMEAEKEVEVKQERVLADVSRTIITLVREVAPYEANGLKVPNKLKNSSREYETSKYRWEKISQLLYQKAGVKLDSSGVRRRVCTILKNFKIDNGIEVNL